MTHTVSGRLSRSVGQLALALLNATLILVVLGLLLAWNLSRTVERITETAVAAATNQLAEFKPLADEISGVQDQLAKLRVEVADLRGADDTKVAEASEAVLSRLAVLDEAVLQMGAELGPAINKITTDPGVLVDRAVETGIAATGAWVSSLTGCGTSPEGS
ncbi:MAG: hypothetical protein AAF724_22005 [Pseudomonadota bacterium]